MEVIDIPYYTHEQIIKAFQNRGTTLEDQHDNHSGGALQVKRAAALLHLPWYTVATALYFYHRFYVRYPPPEPEFLITGCLSLAMKAQETTKRLRDIYQSVLNHDKAEYTKDLRDRIMDIERLVLQDTLFQTTIHHPFRYIVNIAKQMSLSKDLGSKAWDICEQIYQTFLCLCYTPHEIAFACLYTSALSLYSSPPDFFSHKMCSRFDVSYDIVIEIATTYCNNTLQTSIDEPTRNKLKHILLVLQQDAQRTELDESKSHLRQRKDSRDGKDRRERRDSWDSKDRRYRKDWDDRKDHNDRRSKDDRRDRKDWDSRKDWDRSKDDRSRKDWDRLKDDRSDRKDWDRLKDDRSDRKDWDRSKDDRSDRKDWDRLKDDRSDRKDWDRSKDDRSDRKDWDSRKSWDSRRPSTWDTRVRREWRSDSKDNGWDDRSKKTDDSNDRKDKWDDMHDRKDKRDDRRSDRKDRYDDRRYERDPKRHRDDYYERKPYNRR